MMPILQPLGQVLGINQQVMVLAYQYGDGFTNTFWPTASLLQLSLCGMDYGHWFKFAWKIYACLITAGVPPDHYCKPDRLRSLLNTAWRGRRIVGAAPRRHF